MPWRMQRYPEIEKVNHVHHAGNSSGIVDGAAAILIGSKEFGEKAGLKPRARIRSFASVGSEPAIMLTGPAPSSEKALKRAGMSVKDIDLWELNEAFAAVVLRYLQVLKMPHDRINVNGGAIAMGHPLGATGAMILGTAARRAGAPQPLDRPRHALRRRRHGHRDHHRARLETTTVAHPRDGRCAASSG